MKRWLSGMLLMVLTVTLCAAQQTSPSAPASQPLASGGQQQGVFQVALAKGIDSKKLKVGDTVEAQVPAQVKTPAGMTIPRGAKVIGHVTQVQLRSKGDAQSTLGIVFDKISVAHGEEIPIKGVIQAIAPNPSEGVSTGGGVGYGGMNETMEKPPTPDMSRGNVPLLNNASVGVSGLKNLQLGQDGVLSSSEKDIKLENGTRMLLNVTM